MKSIGKGRIELSWSEHGRGDWRVVISKGKGSALDRSDPSSDAKRLSETTPHFQNVAIDLRSVIDGMSEGFALLGNDFTILDLNAEALRLESRTKNQIVGGSHWDVYPGSEGNPIGALYKLAMRERIPVSLEHIIGSAIMPPNRTSLA